MARTIHCTVVEVPAMTDPYLPAPREFRDLVPWADPYITSLLNKLGRAAAAERGWSEAAYESEAVGELPPPLDKEDRLGTWQADWTERDWPRGYRG